MMIKYFPGKHGWLFDNWYDEADSYYTSKYAFKPIQFIKHAIEQHDSTPQQTCGGANFKKPRTGRKSNPAPSKD